MIPLGTLGGICRWVSLPESVRGVQLFFQTLTSFAIASPEVSILSFPAAV
jgi:hypothetical protein